MEHRSYLLVGDKKNWETLRHQMWGFSERFRGYWNKINEGEKIAFYVTSPVKKIIGFGNITQKYVNSSELIWNDELLFKRSLWPYKIRFDILYIIKDWENGICPPEGVMLNVGRKVVTQKQFEMLIKNVDMKWKTKLFKNIPHL